MRLDYSIEDRVITIYSLLDLEGYYHLLEDDINDIKAEVEDFDKSFFLLYGYPYKEAYQFNSAEELNDFFFSDNGVRLFSNYGSYLKAYGEKYLEYK